MSKNVTKRKKPINILNQDEEEILNNTHTKVKKNIERKKNNYRY